MRQSLIEQYSHPQQQSAGWVFLLVNGVRHSDTSGDLLKLDPLKSIERLLNRNEWKDSNLQRKDLNKNSENILTALSFKYNLYITS